MNNEQLMKETMISEVENSAKTTVEDLFECEVVDTAYTCHENRNSTRSH